MSANAPGFVQITFDCRPEHAIMLCDYFDTVIKGNKRDDKDPLDTALAKVEKQQQLERGKDLGTKPKATANKAAAKKKPGRPRKRAKATTDSSPGTDHPAATDAGTPQPASDAQPQDTELSETETNSEPGEDSTEEVTKEVAFDKFKELNAKKGMDACIEALARFGCKRFSDVFPEQYANFVIYIDEQIGAV